MLLSMTGYGNAVATFQDRNIHVEIRTLNSKSLDLAIRMPSRYREHEMELRAILGESLIRGKVDATIWIENNGGDEGTLVNQAQIQSYYQQIKRITEQMQLPEPNDWMTILMRMPDVIQKNDTVKAEQQEWEMVKDAVQQALQHVNDFRKQEGDALTMMFNQKIENIGQLLQSITPYEESRTEKIKNRIEEALNNIAAADYDHNRLEQELIYYIEKLDISEEKQRLSNHLQYFMQTMNEPGPHGKKLGFISQEMGREINTTGSKSNQAEMQNIVVMMKDELEQIKEQVLNVL